VAVQKRHVLTLKSSPLEAQPRAAQHGTNTNERQDRGSDCVCDSMPLAPRTVPRSIPSIIKPTSLTSAQAPPAHRPAHRQIFQPHQLHKQRRRYTLTAMAPAPPHKGGRPIVISGPSGSGKSTMVKRLLEKYPNRFALSVSRTCKPSLYIPHNRTPSTLSSPSPPPSLETRTKL
jgi:hypothetical protein